MNERAVERIVNMSVVVRGKICHRVMKFWRMSNEV
jgi:hypothetical protein